MKAKSKSLMSIKKRSSIVLKTTSDGHDTYHQTILKTKSDQQIRNCKKELDIDDHYITLEKLIYRYNTNLQTGLTKVKAVELLKANGPNCLVPSQQTSRLLILAEFMFGGFGVLLWSGGILSYSSFCLHYYSNPNTPLDEVYLGSLLIATIVFTGLFGYYQESVNAAIMEGFKKLTPSYATVVRDGFTIVLPSEELVLGDLVKVKSGDVVPADIRIIESQGLKVDNSSITGESDPQIRSTQCTDRNPLETANLAFYGTNVVEGMGSGIVVACGDDTLIGHIAALTSDLEKTETPMRKEIKSFIKIISVISILEGIIFFGLFMAMGYNFTVSFTYFIAIIVGNVPEGLLVTLTACLTLTAKRMKRKNCLVKNLQAIETLGATNVICSDKTGTLTQNRMTVSHMYYNGNAYDVLDSTITIVVNASYESLCRVAILCNRAEFKPDQDNIPINDRQCFGDASETGVLKAMERLVGNVKEYRTQFPKVVEIPFNSVNKYQVSIHVTPSKHHVLVMKGAPERILERCSTVTSEDQDVHLTPPLKTVVEKAILNLASMGERVLAFADMELDAKLFPVGYAFDVDRPNYPLRGLRLVGLMSLIDPPRDTVPDSIVKCRTAGVRVVMVTGDHPATGVAIAKKVGILSGEVEIFDNLTKGGQDWEIKLAKMTLPKGCVVTGTDLRNMSQHTLDAILGRFPEIVFARTSPQQKLQIVESFQRLGAIVAVTGDGVNDSPALKKADIGVAMGITGSDVSKEAADIILLDDNFASIVTGIEEGRLVFDNLKKCIAYVLTSNVPEVVPFILFVTLNIPQALSVMCIIAINTGTDMWPAISLAYENAEADIMLRKPRNPETDKLITGNLIFMTYGVIGIIQSCASFATFFFIMAVHGFFWDRLIGCRSEWESASINDFKDSYGIEWTYDERMALSKKCFAAFFIGVVTTQLSDLLICKTRNLSFFQQGMKNWVMNCGIVFEICLAIAFIYCPGLNTIFNMAPIDWYIFLPAVPFSILIFVYDEVRKMILRKHPNCFIKRELYY